MTSSVTAGVAPIGASRAAEQCHADRVVASSSRNREAWDLASRKYVEESDCLDDERLADVELRLLGPLLGSGPRVVHLQSGNGVDALELLSAGARSAIGVDFSKVAVGAAQTRAKRLGSGACYVVGAVPDTPLASGSADLVYTGKGALVWLSDLEAWAREVARLLVPGGALFVYDAHPAAPLWTRDADEARLDPRQSYFGGTRANDTFPASAISRFGGDGLHAVEWQWTLADIVNSVIGAGMTLAHLGEHPDPFWRPRDMPAATAWDGRLPNAFTLIART
jgi:SAM-dependent methyltransferase